MKAPHWLAHEWTEWSDPFNVPIGILVKGREFKDAGVAVYQKRTCRVCKLQQQRRVEGSP